MKFVVALSLLAASAYAADTYTCTIPAIENVTNAAKVTLSLAGTTGTATFEGKEGELKCEVAEITKEAVEKEAKDQEAEIKEELKYVENKDERKKLEKAYKEKLKTWKNEVKKVIDTTAVSCYEDQAYINLFVGKPGKKSYFGYNGGTSDGTSKFEINCQKAQ